jgi:glucose-6-phosphate dehydrogenase assembly protein OpcA
MTERTAGSTVRPIEPDRVRSLEWESENTSVAEILARLARISAELAHREAGDDEHPHPRNCVMNMVALVEDRDESRRVAEIMADLAAHHPSRSIVIHLHSRKKRQQMEASIRADAHNLVDGSPIQLEQLKLHLQGSALEHLRSVVEPLLIPDVRTHLWWTGTPPLDDPAIVQALELCDTLVVDSAAFERPDDSLSALARLADAVGREIGIADFQWARTSPWRATLAQFFEPAARRPFLDGISQVGIDYAGEGRGNRVAAALMAGWLASRLGWRFKGSKAGKAGALAAHLEAPAGHPVDIAFRSAPGEGQVPGEVTAIRIQAAAGGQTAKVEIERKGGGDTATLGVEVGEAAPIRQRLPMARAEEAELLVDLLVQGRIDRVYQRALGAASELLQAAE